MSRKSLLAGNWKMNNLIADSETLVKGLVANLGNITDKDILICPPFMSIAKTSEIIKGSHIKLGAQNCATEDNGAYTGEVSPSMLIDAGCEYVIIGHSERREYYKETDAIINKKTNLALSAGLKVILCVGETLEDRELDNTFNIIERQITEGLKNIDVTNVIIAYEPVWAIGTGKVATPEEAEAVHAFIRQTLANLYKNDSSQSTQILYGGSMNPGNVEGLMSCPNIDGGLIGGASLKVDSFTDLVTKA
ncbi:MAG: triose-phosphate isomerase [bacterium]|nr:triose-phosphate isomerase [bacterium]